MIPLTPYRTSLKVKGSGLWVLGLEENGLGLRLGFGHRVLGVLECFLDAMGAM